MLGDTGVAVNPNDERFKDLINKKVKLPITNREVPIFADEYVDMEKYFHVFKCKNFIGMQ